MICSKDKFDPELDKILSILVENGYPEHLIKSTIKSKLQQLNLNPVQTVKKCPVYLHIPWIGNISIKFEKHITSAVKHCFFSVESRVVFTTRQLLPATKKHVLPSHHQNSIIYQFVCHCDSRYVGRTSQRLEERIKQHIPKSITNPPNPPTPHIRQSLPHPGKDTSPNNFTNPPSVNIFLKTPNVLYITLRKNSLSSLEPAPLFISPPWKRLSSNLWILFSANKKNSFTPWRSPEPLKLSIGWLFQRFDEVQITSSTNANSSFLIS